jgi:hypothetical protein
VGAAFGRLTFHRVRCARHVAALLMLLLLGATPVAPARAVTPAHITLNAIIDLTCGIFGVSDSPGDLVNVVWRNADGHIKWEFAVSSNGISGLWSPPTCPSFQPAVAIGDKFHISGEGGVNPRDVTVPRLTVIANRVSDVVSGHAPKNSSVDVSGCHGYTGCTAFGPRTVSTSPTGGYFTDFTSTANLQGKDQIRVVWDNTTGEEFSAQGNVPYVIVSLGDSFFSGAAKEGSLVTLSLKTGSGVLRGKGQVQPGAFGRFAGEIYNANGGFVYPRVGDHVSTGIASDALFVFPAISVTAVAQTDAVSGQCLPNRIVDIRAPNAVLLVTCDSTGHFGTTLSGGGGISSKDRVYVLCQRPTGDLVSAITFAT